MRLSIPILFLLAFVGFGPGGGAGVVPESSGNFGAAGGFSSLTQYRFEDMVSGDNAYAEQESRLYQAQLGWFERVNNNPLFNSSLSFTGRVDQLMALSYEDLVKNSHLLDPDGDELVLQITARAGSFLKNGTNFNSNIVLLHRGESVQWRIPARIEDLHQAFDFRAADPFGFSSSTIVGNSYFKPVILDSPGSLLKLKLGDSIVLKANLSGSAPMLMEWDKGGRIIPGNSSPSLVIDSASRKDIGLYSFFARNDFGSAYMGIFEVGVQVPQMIDPPSISQSGITISFKDVDGSFLENYNENDFIIYRSQDLVTWTAITNAVLKSNIGKLDFTDPSPGTGRRFYKVESK